MSKKLMVIFLMILILMTGCNKIEKKATEEIQSTEKVEANNTIKEEIKKEIKEEIKKEIKKEIKEEIKEETSKEKQIGEITLEDINKNPKLLEKLTGFSDEIMEYERLYTTENKIYDVLFMKDGRKEPLGYMLLYGYSSTLYVFVKDGIVLEATVDEFNGPTGGDGGGFFGEPADTVVYMDMSDTVLACQPKAKDLTFDPKDREKSEKFLNEKFVGKDIFELENFLNVHRPITKYMRSESRDNLEVFIAVSDNGYTDSTAINVIHHKFEIKRIYLDNSYRPEKDPIEELAK